MLWSKNKRVEARKTEKFRSTNKMWNDLGLNQKKNIGAVIFLAKQSKAKTFEEWERYYFESGEKRNELLSKSHTEYELKKINNEHGRTKEDLLEIAKEFQKHIDLPLETVYNYVYIRVIDETWIGHSRELKAMRTITTECEKFGLTVSDVDYYVDMTYAIDFEVKRNNNPILAIQLKSVKYRDSTLVAVDEIKTINKEKNAAYTSRYGADVLYLYTDYDRIVNLNELRSFLNNL